jgi:hypothetical protein
MLKEIAMNKTEATQLIDIIVKQRPSVEATPIDMGNKHIIRLDYPNADSGKCCVQYIINPKDWAKIAQNAGRTK